MSEACSKLKKITVRVNLDYQSRKKTGFIARAEAFFYRHKEKLVWVHISMFFLFLALILIPLFLPQPDENATLFTHFTMFAQFILWGLWFPLVFASVIVSGRSWCGLLCPMGAASEWATKIGLKRPIPAWLKWEGTPILSFLIITILGQTVDVRDQASAIAEVFGGMLLLALLIGFLYGKTKKRAWCRHVCPIGLLLGVFSRLGAIQFASKLKKAGPDDQYTEKGICPTMIAIHNKQESRHCIQCFRCVKPSSSGGLFVRLRHLGEEIIAIDKHSPNFYEVLFIFLSTGIALGGFLWLVLPSYQTVRQWVGEWAINHGLNWIGASGPAWLMSVHPDLRQSYNWLDFLMIVGFMLTCMLLTTTLLSLCTLASSYLTGKWQQPKTTLRTRFTTLGYQFSPVAVISIIIGLGDTLFGTLQSLGMNGTLLASIKLTLLIASILWSIYLGHRILMRQGLTGIRNFIALLPGILGSILIGLAWWPATIGLHFSMLEQYRQQLMILN